MTNDHMQFITIVCDDSLHWVNLWPWLLVALTPTPAIRCLFRLRDKGTARTARAARRCYFALHLLFAAVAACVTCDAALGSFRLRHVVANSLALFNLQCVTISHALWPLLFQLFLAQISALVIIFRTGVRPRLWHPACTAAAIVLCAVAQAIVFGMVSFMMQ